MAGDEDRSPIRLFRLRQDAIGSPPPRTPRLATETQFLGTPLVLLFFFLAFWHGYLVVWALKVLKLERLRSIVFDTGLSSAVIVPFLAFAFSPQVFKARYWRIPRKAWKGVLAVVALQMFLIYIDPHGHTITIQHAVAALVFAPLLEEIIRAVLLPPLMARWGTIIGIVGVTALTAFVHNYGFARAAVYQLALTIIFVKNDRSIPATAISHFVMNAIGVASLGIQ